MSDLEFATLLSMGYEKQYIERAIDVHRRSKYGTNWDLSVLCEIIVRLQEKDDHFVSKWQRVNEPNNELGDGSSSESEHSANPLIPRARCPPAPQSQRVDVGDDSNGLEEEAGSGVFVGHYPNVDIPLSLEVNDFVDYRYENGRYLLCKIIAKSQQLNNMMLLHPVGKPIYDTKYDRLVNIFEEYYKLAPARSVCLRQIAASHSFSSLRINDYVDINPYCNGRDHEGWKNGKIIKLDSHSSQIKVVYHLDADGKNYSFWVHLMNGDEVQEFRSMEVILQRGRD